MKLRLKSVSFIQEKILVILLLNQPIFEKDLFTEMKSKFPDLSIEEHEDKILSNSPVGSFAPPKDHVITFRRYTQIIEAHQCVLDMKDKKIKVKAILFDLDGTIFDITERDAFARYKALKQLGYSVSLEEVRKHYRYGIGRMGIVRELGIRFAEKDEREYIETSFAHFAKRKNALKLTKIHNEAYNALSILSGEYKLVLVTSRDTLSSTEEELEWFNIRDFFTLIITREVAARYHGVKDIPLLPFQEQRKKLYECAIGLTKIDSGDMLCIGDSVGELEPAKKLGMKTIGVLTGFSSKEDMEKASISTIQNLTHLVRILDSSNNILS